MAPEKAFGGVLRELRLSRELSQEALAHACGLDRTFISLLERGRRQPTLATLFKFSKALSVPASRIVAKVERTLKRR
jgi:transcriptional regulator with XRE-family HTH domain